MLKIFGASDDLIIIEGQANEEIGCYDVDVEISFIDGTIVLWHYGKDNDNLAIWNCEVKVKGDKFDKLEICNDEDATIYSDVLYMKDSNECLILSVEEF